MEKPEHISYFKVKSYEIYSSVCCLSYDDCIILKAVRNVWHFQYPYAINVKIGSIDNLKLTVLTFPSMKTAYGCVIFKKNVYVALAKTH